MKNYQFIYDDRYNFVGCNGFMEILHECVDKIPSGVHYIPMPKKINQILFWGLLTLLCVSYFTRKSLITIDDISPKVLRQPYQSRVYSSRPIIFTKNGFKYQVTPLYDYIIDGLIVCKMTYKFFNIYKNESVFPLDIALIWGSNVANEVYKKRNVKFEQDMRWVFVRYAGDIIFNANELSNNHLVIDDAKLEKQALSLCPGDQVSIRGKLANITATSVKDPEEKYVWNTSTSRSDQRAGACEVIYVESIKVLKKGNMLSHILFAVSFWGLLSLIVFNLARFFIGF